MDKNFKEEPKGFTELRAERACDAALMSPRDALVRALRKIDAGEITPDMMLILHRDSTKYTVAGMGKIAAGVDGIDAMGMLEAAKFIIAAETTSESETND